MASCPPTVGGVNMDEYEAHNFLAQINNGHL